MTPLNSIGTGGAEAATVGGAVPRAPSGYSELAARVDGLAVRFVSLLFFAAVMFPFLKVLPIESDTQPYALVMSAVLVLAAREWRLPWEIALLFIVFCYSLGAALLGSVGSMAVRSIANYASLFFISYAAYLALCHSGELFPRVLKYVVVTWFAVGLIQTFVYPEFLVFLTPRALGTTGYGGRGAVGLSPEPSHYGTFCLLLLVLVFVMRGRQLSERETRWLAGALIFQLLIFSRSAMAALIFVLIAGWFLIVHLSTALRVFYVLVGLLAAGGIGAIAVGSGAISLDGSRMTSLIGQVIENPRLVLLVDGSVNDRVFHIVFTVVAFVENWFLPRGYTSWIEYMDIGVQRFQPYAWHVTTTRIMSGYGAPLFELGFIGALIPLIVNVGLYRVLRSDIRSFLIAAFALNMMLWTAIPLAWPPVGFIIGFLVYSARFGEPGVIAGRGAEA